MNRSQLVVRIAARLELDRRDVRRVLDALFGASREAGLIAELLEDGDKIVINGFGSFVPVLRPARQVRGIQRDRVCFLPARRSVRFKLGQALRDRLRLR